MRTETTAIGSESENMIQLPLALVRQIPVRYSILGVYDGLIILRKLET